VLSDCLRDQRDDEAADVARGPLFPTLLAVARFEKITGRLGVEAVASTFDAFRGAGEAIAEAHQQAERQRATSAAPRPGGRDRMPEPKVKRKPRT
jgi:hypothetical protein